MPAWLVAILKALDAESTATIILNGVRSEVSLPILAEIEQGCPAPGTLWALAYDPIARALCWATPRDLGCLGVFADDIGVALRHLFDGMVAPTPVLQDMAAAAGPRSNGRKSKLLY